MFPTSLTNVVSAAVESFRPVSFRGKVRLLNRLIPEAGVKRAKVFGYSIDLDLASFVERMIYLGCYEPTNSLRFRQILKPGMTVVDVGANIGYYSLLACSLVGPKGKVISVEPHPVNFATLSENLKSNDLLSIATPVAYALGDEPGQGSIRFPKFQGLNNRTATMIGEDKIDGIAVQVKTIDECVKEWGISTIDLLKIDVDGFETKILNGAKETLKRGVVKNVIIEFNDYWLRATGSSPELMTAFFKSFGFRDVSDLTRLSSLVLGPTKDRRFTLEK